MEALSTNSAYSPSSSSSTDNDYNCYQTVTSAPPKRPAGRTKFKETRHPIYKGVRQRGAAGRWVCEVREPNKKSRLWLGTFQTAELAARAHDFAAIALRGRSACLNFADSAWLLDVPKSFSSSRDLVRLAAKAVEALCPSTEAAPASPPDAESESSATTTLSSTSSSLMSSMLVPETTEGLPMWTEDVLRYDEFELAMEGFSFGLVTSDAAASCCNWDDVDCGADVALWSYSF